MKNVSTAQLYQHTHRKKTHYTHTHTLAYTHTYTLKHIHALTVLTTRPVIHTTAYVHKSIYVYDRVSFTVFNMFYLSYPLSCFKQVSYTFPDFSCPSVSNAMCLGVLCQWPLHLSAALVPGSVSLSLLCGHAC